MDDVTFGDIARISDKWLFSDLPNQTRVSGALVPGRTLLIAGDPLAALALFDRLADAVSPASALQDERYMVLANQAYAHLALARQLKPHGTPAWIHHAQRVKGLIGEIKQFDDGRPGMPKVYAAWHALALADAHNLLGEAQLIQNAITEAADVNTQLRAEAEFFKRLYPDLAKFIDRALGDGNDSDDSIAYESIFLSHTAADKPFVRRLREDLLKRGVTEVWLDEAEIQIGDSLVTKISEGLNKTRYLGIVLSAKSVRSAWVSRELETAIKREMEEKEVVILPLLYEDCEIPLFIAGKLYADFTDPARYEESLTLLLRRLQKTRKE